MRKFVPVLLLVFLSSTFGAAVSKAQSRDYAAEIEAAVRAAKAAAGFEHLGTLNRLCVLPPRFSAPSTEDELPRWVTDPSSIPPRESWYAAPMQAFDELYWVGGRVHSAWLIATSVGHIVIDTQFPYNSGELVLEGMRKLGFDPDDIRYIVISHAHGDHIGGVELVQKASGATVVMGKADWDLVARFPNRYSTMTPDRSNGIEVTEPMVLELGDFSVRIYPTPGHTPGTLSYIFTVHDFGRPVVVAYSGGTAFNFPTEPPSVGIPSLESYIASQEAFAERAANAGATVLLSNHSEFDRAYDKSRMMAGRGFGQNPFESSEASVQGYFDVMTSCARARMIELEQELGARR